MNLSKEHQELVDNLAVPFKVKEGEEGYFHILFVKILPDGKKHVLVPHIQIFNGKDWVNIKQTIEKRGITITQYDEYSILHDPAEHEKAIAEELKKAVRAEYEKAKKEKEAAAKKEAKELADKKAAEDKVKKEAEKKAKAEAAAAKKEAAEKKKAEQTQS